MKKALKIIGTITGTLYFFTWGWVFFSINAHAYIDPSAVTYTIQAVAALFITLGAVLTIFRHKILSFFRKKSDKSPKREIHIKEDSQNTSDIDQ